jgi:hypothetical protein
MRALVLGFTVGVCAAGCGGDVSADGGNAGAGQAGLGGGGTGAGGASAGGSSGSGGAIDAGFDVFVDPGCPDAGPAPVINSCDPFAAESGCRFDEGCYPFVQYPSDRCGTELFGTQCLPAGSGTQGSDCETDRCAPGFVCIVGGAPGTRCAELCSVFGENSCPRGLLCEPIDIQQGLGGCI